MDFASANPTSTAAALARNARRESLPPFRRFVSPVMESSFEMRNPVGQASACLVLVSVLRKSKPDRLKPVLLNQAARSLQFFPDELPPPTPQSASWNYRYRCGECWRSPWAACTR